MVDPAVVMDDNGRLVPRRAFGIFIDKKQDTPILKLGGHPEPVKLRHLRGHRFLRIARANRANAP